MNRREAAHETQSDIGARVSRGRMVRGRLQQAKERNMAE